MNEQETMETYPLPETDDDASSTTDGFSTRTTGNSSFSDEEADFYDEFYFDNDDDDDDDDDDDGPRVTYMQNRELSWLTFNERVLDQGADESVPLLQRLNFISIFWSNLQEFFMVRVGSLTDLSYIEPPVEDSKTGMTPKEQIRAIHERCSELYPIQESYYEHVRGSLAKEGVRHLRPEDISDEQRNYLFGLVKHNIEPFLSPQIINSRHPFPHLENGKLYILVRLDDEASENERKKRKKEKGKKKGKGAAEGVLLGLIPLPHQCERVIKLPGRGYQFILLEHAIEMFVPEIFNMYKIKHTNVICVTRNADIDANQGFDEQDEDYREHMKRLLKQRARLAPVRLECERPLSPVMEKLMLGKLGLKRYQVYDTIVPLDLSFTWGLGSRLSDKKCAKLTDTPFAPAWPTCFDKDRRIMDQVTERETLLFYPYESMDPFVQLLREAAVDPDVVSIKITLYRLASQSHLAEALIAAADAGKEVTALFELRARFDENNNIEWSQRFEEAGCNVIYGFRDYKVHSKICCITRRTPEGIQHITQLGTGNYNEKTAKLYTDLSFITTSEEFGRDAVEFFRNMQLENVSDNYQILRVAPLQIKPLILDNLDKQIANARAGKPATAFMKANSVTDKDVIEKISEASNAGVQITLFVRGICCLVPRVKGATENVRVVSIVGRLLEHSRIYCFGSGDECVVYLSSADLMTRNLNKRVEIAWPVRNPELRDRVLTYIDICMNDTAKLRELRPNATYTPLGAFCDIDDEGNAKPAFDAQNTLIDQAAEAARIMSEMTAAEAEEAKKAEERSEEETVPEATGAVEAAPEADVVETASDMSASVEEAMASVEEIAPESAASAEETAASVETETVTEEPTSSEDDEAQEEPAPEELSQEEPALEEPSEEPSQEEPQDEPTQEELFQEDAVSEESHEEASQEEPTGQGAEADTATVTSAEPEPEAEEQTISEDDATPTVETEPSLEVIPEESTTQEPTSPEEAPESIKEETAKETTNLEDDMVQEEETAIPATELEPATAEEAPAKSEPDEATVALEEKAEAETQTLSGQDAAPAQSEVSTAVEALDDTVAILDFNDASPTSKSIGQVDTTPTSEPIAETVPVASERVAELIDQLGTSSDQKATIAREPLTEMKVEEIVASLRSSTPSSTSTEDSAEALASEPAGAGADAAAMAQIGHDIAQASAGMASDASQAFGSEQQNANVQPMQAQEDANAQPTQQVATTDSQSVQQSGESAPGINAGDYLSQKSREIEIPKKRKGFFARWFG